LLTFFPQKKLDANGVGQTNVIHHLSSDLIVGLCSFFFSLPKKETKNASQEGIQRLPDAQLFGTLLLL